jgi:hypothetical protein
MNPKLQRAIAANPLGFKATSQNNRSAKHSPPGLLTTNPTCGVMLPPTHWRSKPCNHNYRSAKQFVLPSPLPNTQAKSGKYLPFQIFKSNGKKSLPFDLKK